MAKKQSSKNKECSCCKLDESRIGLAFGIFTAFYMLLLAILSGVLGLGSVLLRLLSSIYLGYDATLKGAFFGMFWGFIDGFLAGYIFTWIYKKLAK